MCETILPADDCLGGSMAMSVRDIGADIRITLLACCATVPSQQLISALCDAVPLMMHVGMWRLEKKPIDARVGESSLFVYRSGSQCAY